MEYYLIEEQSGGCDYTIGCGIRITKLNANDLGTAMVTADKEIGSSWQAIDEHGIDKARLLEVNQTLDLSQFLDGRAAERKSHKRIADEQAQKQKDEAEFERLKQKLGK